MQGDILGRPDLGLRMVTLNKALESVFSDMVLKNEKANFKSKDVTRPIEDAGIWATAPIQPVLLPVLPTQLPLVLRSPAGGAPLDAPAGMS